MNAKLTLSLDKETIEKAKAYAKQQGTSISKLVEHFIKVTTSKVHTDETNEIEISDFVKSLSTPGVKPRSKAEMRAEYADHIKKKHST